MDHIAERHDVNWHHDWDRRHAHFDHGHFFVFINGFWCGLDDGFFPWDYLPYYPNDYNPYDYYADVDPYDNNGTGYNIAPADSATVQAVQRQLLDLGYYNGSIDGVFGPSTRDAETALRFQSTRTQPAQVLSLASDECRGHAERAVGDWIGHVSPEIIHSRAAAIE